MTPALDGSDRTNPTHRRRLLLIAGALLLIGGLSMIGWYAWQLYGTNWVSKRIQQEIVADVEERWDAGATGDTGGDRVIDTEYGDAIGIVHIPRFGSDYAIPLMETTSLDVLRAGFGHFDMSAGPGERGNFAIAAHRITRNEPLRRMPELLPGDEVIVETTQATYTYEMTTPGGALRITFHDTWVVDPRPVNPDSGCADRSPGCINPPADSDRLITLTTCADLFHSDYRLAAFGKLVAVEPRSHRTGSTER